MHHRNIHGKTPHVPKIAVILVCLCTCDKPGYILLVYMSPIFRVCSYRLFSITHMRAISFVNISSTGFRTYEACSVWDPHTKDQQQKLEKVQSRAARYVQNNYDYTSSTTAMINTLEWPTLAERRLKTRQTTKDAYKWSFFPNAIIQWNMLPQTVIASTSADCFRVQLKPAVLSQLY